MEFFGRTGQRTTKNPIYRFACGNVRAFRDPGFAGMRKWVDQFASDARRQVRSCTLVHDDLANAAYEVKWP